VFEIGNTLREARTRRGLDIFECESATKIRAKYLRAMEEEQFDLMPSPAYVRGFLRTYAEYLDLDGRLMLDEYESRFGATPRAADEGSPRIGGGGRGGGRRERIGGTPKPRRGRRTEAQLLWLAIGGVTGVALLVWMGVGGESPSSDAPIPGPAATTAPTEADTTAAAPAAPAATTTPAGDARVQISVEGVEDGSWVLVHGRNASGPLLYVGTLGPGESRTWRVGRSVWLRAGDPSGVSVTVGSREVELAGGTGDFIVSRTGAKRVSTG